MYVDMINFLVKLSFGKVVIICLVVVGFSFVVGIMDGFGVFDFI